jgi:D-psicose/D-tagatose/L-ribulose 3-epimerase
MIRRISMNVTQLILGLLISSLWSTPATIPSQQKQSCRIQVGCCAPLKDMEAVQAAGFDYLEPMVSEIAGMSDADFAKYAGRLKELKIATPSANVFLPGKIKVTGPAVDPAAQADYLKKAMGRLESLGIRIVVFGSSGSRNVPDGFPREQALQQLVEFCRLAGAEAGTHNITIVVEPLRPQESNIINTAAEGLALVQAVNHPNVRLLVDFYHMASQKEDFTYIEKAGADIRHAHIANPAGRIYPKPGDGCDYSGFFEALRHIGYCSRLSVEAGTKDMPQDAPLAIALIRAAFQR